MAKLKALCQKHRELVLYVVFGGLTTAVDFIAHGAVYFLLRSRLSEDNATLAANVAAWIAAVAFAYVTNKLFVFEQKSWAPRVLRRELPSFVGARLLSLAVAEALLLLFIKSSWKGGILDWLEPMLSIPREQLATWYNVGVKLPIQVMVLILNYIFSKFIIFKKKEGTPR